MKRIALLDLWRSLAVCVMVVFHALYDLELFGVLPAGTMSSPAAEVVRWLGAGSFILISGMVVRFSRDALRRGFFLFCAGLLVTLATTLVGMPVKFGILQLLGSGMMLYGLLRERIERLQGPAFAAACLLLFAGTWLLTGKITVDIKWIYPLGLRYEGFYSADYFPLIPWLFLFLSGTYFGKKLDEHREKPALQRTYPRFLTAPGRYSLGIYLLHQPLLYGIFWCCFH